jgi:hypothetical protein
MKHRYNFLPTLLPVGLLKVKLKVSFLKKFKSPVNDTIHIGVEEVETKLHTFLTSNLDRGMCRFKPKKEGQESGWTPEEVYSWWNCSSWDLNPINLKSLY